MMRLRRDGMSSNGRSGDVEEEGGLHMLPSAMVDTLRQPLLVLDARFHVELANRAFLRIFRVAPDAVTGRCIYDLGDGQWDIPSLRLLLERVLPEQQAV